MKANKIACITESDVYSEEVAELYNETGSLDEFVELVREQHPDAFFDEPCDEDIPEYELCGTQDESERYILTFCDDIIETIIIYEKS